ncbi:cell wall hydrolase [Paenibacillus pini]|uniref:Cell wall hydrolase SleB domain-containing protein n=1 Tax=Paenibacillus pini JCM 16418 TaxID=1236976 RepID=W7YK35_9BACL|nr:cell wall hydrolase [Paenibacillus pini]GAF08053.1 hypothetical protein JCM16418_2090 [Paenibacillus pini JCM 16418]
MYTLRQNRWMALLIGVLLVCFSAVCLLLQNEQSQKVQYSNEMDKLVAAKQTTDSFGSVNTAHKKLQKQSQISAKNSLQLVDGKKLNSWKIVQYPVVIKQLPASNSGQVLHQLKPKAAQASQAGKVKPAINYNPKLNSPKILYFSRTRLLSPSDKSQSTKQYTVSADDVLLLRKIVMAEAEGEPYQGKVAVANVVLNRLRSANFPDTIKGVIFQKFQFSPVANGRFKRVHPNQDSIHAVNEALNGIKSVSDDTYYFLSLTLADDLTVHNTRTYAKTIGHHTFYK